MDLPRFVLALAAACSLAHAHAECAPVEILDPVRNSTIHSARPDIRWGRLSGVKAYRVQIESRVPEGQVLERIDARVGDTRFVPPRPPADRRAAGKLRVPAAPPPARRNAPHTAWCLITTQPDC